MLKNHNLILEVTSTDFVALLFATIRIEMGKIRFVPGTIDESFFAILFTMETLTLPELLELIEATKHPLLSLALKEGSYLQIKEEYVQLTKHLNTLIENSTGEEA